MNQSTHTQAVRAGTRLSNYTVEALLGVGGFGISYRGKEQITDRMVAIKEYLPTGIAVRGRDGASVGPISDTASADFEWGLARFRQEARLLIGLKHPNIVPVLSYFEANGTGYLVMEFQEGRSLGTILKDSGPLTEEELLEILDPLISGVEEVHRKGILHRDIKPDNIFIRMDGSPVLLDFGAARQALKLHSRGFTAVLSEGYGPPEQYYPDGNQGPWTDVYALGAVMYHCLVGTRPVDAVARLRSDRLSRDLDRLQTYLPSTLAQAIKCALAVKESDRPQSIAALREIIWPREAHTLIVGGQIVSNEDTEARSPEDSDEATATSAHRSKDFDLRRRFGKYAPLYEQLIDRTESEWRTTFEELEDILRFPLPRSARTHRPWWGNVRTNNTHRHAVAWRSAGWKVGQVDIGSEKVVFVRERSR